MELTRSQSFTSNNHVRDRHTDDHHPERPSSHDPAHGKWQREFEAFQRLLPQLLTQYSGQYVAVHDGQVVDHGPDEIALALRFFAQHGNVPIHVGLVTAESAPVAHVPRYRELPGERS